MNRPSKSLHAKDAFTLLESGTPCTVRAWKLSNGEIVTYEGVVCISHNYRAGTHRVRFPQSNLVRTMRDITMFEINGFEVYR